jgi:hypothetical protein
MTRMDRLDEVARQGAIRSLRHLVQACGTRVSDVAKNFFRLPSMQPYRWYVPSETVLVIRPH